jgi:hypothetical protein
MSYPKRLSITRLCITIFALVFALSALAQNPEKSSEKSKDNNARSAGTPVLWRDPGNIAAKDLFWGSGSQSTAPNPPFTFVEEDASGTKPKVEVTDANAEKWKVKFGDEVHAETAATRLIWALGYGVEETYFVPSGKINGITSLQRAKEYITADGSLRMRGLNAGQRTSNALR